MLLGLKIPKADSYFSMDIVKISTHIIYTTPLHFTVYLLIESEKTSS